MEYLGRYEIQRELGHGAMGVVYSAVDPLIGRQVAIKTIRLDILEIESNHEELTQRLHLEARAAGVLSHPGIITIYDVGEQGTNAYIVMEFIEGQTLEEMLASGAAPGASTLSSIVKKTADALDYAHSKGIIHRDIKPSNIMVCPDGAVKIADFGVAKLTASASMTRAGFVLGTPSYMSPEQAQGQTVDSRSDQFSFAVVVYRLLTGTLPFEGSTLTAILTKILWEQPEYESAGLHPPVRSIFETALNKDPRLRYNDCREFVRELEAACAGSGVEGLDGVVARTEPYDAHPASGKVHSGLEASSATSVPERMFDPAGKGKLQTASSIIPPAETADAWDIRENDRSASPSAAAAADQKPERKSVFIAGAVVLLVAAMAAVAFLIIRPVWEQPPTPQELSSETIAVLENREEEPVPFPEVPDLPEKDAAAVMLPPTALQPGPDKTVAAEKAEVKTKQPVAAAERSDPAKVPAAPPASKPKQPVASASRPDPTSGIVTWTGTLERNAILVITQQQASIGSVEGQLPGKPARFEVEPAGLVVRQMPAEINRWNQIILYSGNGRYSSITIRWELIP